MSARRNPFFEFDPTNAAGPRKGPDVGRDVTEELLAGRQEAESRKPAARGGSAAPADQPAAPMSVSLLVSRIKTALGDAFPARVAVVGEISNLKQHTSGHLYFRLKDARATIDAVMFRAAAMRVKFRVEDGLEVVVEGRVDVYEARGQLQLYVERMSPKGAGSLELAFRQLKERLHREGLFEAAHKIPLPPYPRAIGVATSLTGAAIRDIRRTLTRRWPAADVYLLPSLVQGEGAAEQLAESIRLLDASAERLGIDTIIVARGGGSLEDLWAFNEEAVARAVYAARTPIISGVGHETDVTICDLVADVRAATPTAAAELAVPDRAAVGEALAALALRLGRLARQRLQTAGAALEGIRRSAIFRDPSGRIRTQVQRLDELSHRLRAAVRHRVAEGRRALEPPANRLAALHPARLRERASATVDRLAGRLAWALGGRSKRAGDALAALFARMTAVHPEHRISLARQSADRLAGRLAWALGGRSKRAGDCLAAIVARMMAVHPDHRVKLSRQEVEAAARQLEAMSYRSVLRRGYSVTRSAEGGILRSAGQVAPGEAVETELADGRFRSRVEDGRNAPGAAADPPPDPPRRQRPRKAGGVLDGPTLFD